MASLGLPHGARRRDRMLAPRGQLIQSRYGIGLGRNTGGAPDRPEPGEKFSCATLAEKEIDEVA